jgi:hypothetical protein
MFGVWLAVAEGTLLGFEAQRVIALRAVKIAAGGYSAPGPAAHAETARAARKPKRDQIQLGNPFSGSLESFNHLD